MKKTFTKLFGLLSVFMASWMLCMPGQLSAQTYTSADVIAVGTVGAVAGVPYPSVINVTGGPAFAGSVSVTLNGVSHTWPSDLDIVLVGPNGQSIFLMSDCGGGTDILGINLTFEDAAAASVPAGAITAGTYRPTDRNGFDADALPAPFAGPAGSPFPVGAATLETTFSTSAADGDWSLYVWDDAGGDGGQINGWSITFSPLPGCLDATACNFNPAAEVDNGTCCYGTCLTMQVTAGTFPGEVSWDLLDGSGTSLLSGGAPFFGNACAATVGCDYVLEMNDSANDGWDGATYTIVDEGTGDIVSTGTMPAAATNPVEVQIAVGVIAGCTDVNASNYDPNATCDNGSCIICAPGEQLLFFNMADLGGDGWDGGTYLITDQAGSTIYSTGTLATAAVGDGGSAGYNSFCAPSGCYYVTVTGSGSAEEISWYVADGAGNVTLSQAAPAAGSSLSVGFPWAGASGCDVPGCTNGDCFNYNPYATSDNGTCICPPPGDICADAIAIACGASVTGDLTNATLDTGAPECAGVGSNTPGVWYQLIGTGDQVTFSTCGSGWDTDVRVYEGNCGNLTCIAGADGGCPANFSGTATWTAENGVSYYILVNRFSEFNTNTSFNVNVTCTSCTAPVINDDCATALPQPDGVPTPGSLCCANFDDVAPSTIAPRYGVWYTVNSQDFETIAFTLVNGDVEGVDDNDNTNLSLSVFSGSCGSLTLVQTWANVADPFTNNLFTTNDPLTANTDYYIWVYTTDASNCGTFTLTSDLAYVGCTDPAADNYDATATVSNPNECTFTLAPVNDLCADAITLEPNGTYAGTTGGSTATGAPASCNIAADNGVWFVINGDDQFHTVSTCGSSIDTRIQVVTSTAGCDGPFTCVIGENNDATCGDDASVDFIAAAGTTYYVYVSAVADGDYTITNSVEAVLVGCTQSCACNYDPNANVTDNTLCDYFSCVDCTDGTVVRINMQDSYGDGWNGATYTLTNGLGEVISTGNVTGANCFIDGQTPSVSPDQGWNMVCLPAGCYNMTVTAGGFPAEVSWSILDATGTVYANGGGGATADFNVGGGSCGCTDDTACNFDPNATIDDNSCEYASCTGCTDVTACNYDATATISDAASCCYSNCLTFIMTDDFGDGWEGNIASFTDLATGEVVATATLEDGLTQTELVCLADGCYSMTIAGGVNAGEIGWTLTGTNSGILTGTAAGAQFSVGTGNCNVGCTEPVACNYDPTAGVADCTLCEYSSCLGCTYANAVNYDAEARIDDGSCEIVGGTTCLGDLDFNGVVNVNDLSLFLSVFGTICE